MLPTDNGIKVAGMLEKLAGGAVGDPRPHRQYARTSHSADTTASAPNAQHNYLRTHECRDQRAADSSLNFRGGVHLKALVSFRVCDPGTAE